MMRKLWMMAAIAGSFFICTLGSAQTGAISPGTITAGACCNQGVPTVPAGQQCLLLHKVGPGENLHILAAYYYGDARAWRRIYELNKKTIRNPNKIVAGQILRIEIDPCWTPRFDLQEFLRLETRRMELLKRAPGERPMEYRSHVEIAPPVPVIIEEEGGPEEEAGGTVKEKPASVPGEGPIPRAPTIAPSTPPEETAPGGGTEGGE